MTNFWRGGERSDRILEIAGSRSLTKLGMGGGRGRGGGEEGDRLRAVGRKMEGSTCDNIGIAAVVSVPRIFPGRRFGRVTRPTTTFPIVLRRS